MKNNNYCIIMSGGIGNRFWPYSNEKTPKQFLDFFGTGRSLLQSTFDRFNKIIPKENIFVLLFDIFFNNNLKINDLFLNYYFYRNKWILN